VQDRINHGAALNDLKQELEVRKIKRREKK
jgi:hypothetical protein